MPAAVFLEEGRDPNIYGIAEIVRAGEYESSRIMNVLPHGPCVIFSDETPHEMTVTAWENPYIPVEQSVIVHGNRIHNDPNGKFTGAVDGIRQPHGTTVCRNGLKISFARTLQDLYRSLPQNNQPVPRQAPAVL